MSLKRQALCASLALFVSTAFAAAPNPAVSSLRLYVFDCGTIDVSDLSVFSPGAHARLGKPLAQQFKEIG